MISGRKSWREDLKKSIKKNQKYIWIHCASLGEFEQGRPLIEKYKSEKPEYKIILTFFSPSGYEVRKNYEKADIICYLPFDTKKNAKDFINIINPEFAVFVKYEFWYYMIEELNKSKIPFFLISGIFRKNQIFFKPYGKFYLKALKHFSFIFLQDKNSENILNEFGIPNTLVCGDTRIDRVVQIAGEKYDNTIFENFSADSVVIVCGSTWPEDEKIISELINTSGNSYKFIIAPHEVDEKHILNIENSIRNTSLRYSSIKDNAVNTNVIIIDSIGLLSKLYRYGTIAYIGGGFGKGIHNILEAAVYEIPVIFGPNYKKFKEAIDLTELKSAFCISSFSELQNTINKLVKDESLYKEIQTNIKKYITNSYGATQQIFDKIKYILKN
ncbi:MAG: 3-deoxy-D-manno-octulosonic acid transferase [Bacteroidales bacterium]|jgi:3-deoxy-D-manno-octulosonic-acid transferase|nr:3-deoxy-D-manno-octulosonic acid transferase [Bacteroidales bacterium]